MSEAGPEAGPQFNDLTEVVSTIVDHLCRLLPKDDEGMTRREGFRAATFVDYFGLRGHLDVQDKSSKHATVVSLTQRVGTLLATKLQQVGGLVVESDHHFYGIAPRFAEIGTFGASSSNPEAPDDFLSHVAVWGSGHKVAMELAVELEHNCFTAALSQTDKDEGLVGWHTGITLLENTTMYLMHHSNTYLKIEPLSEVVNGRKLVHINDNYLRRKNSRGELRHVQVDMAALFYR